MSIQECLQHCTRCHEICQSMIPHCQQKGGAHAAPEHLMLLRDCAEICQLSTQFLSRESPRHVLTCGACAEICQQCADNCAKLPGEDQKTKECMQICRECAESCRQMSQAAR